MGSFPIIWNNMSFTLGSSLVFIDSFQLMSSSLDELAGNLDKSSMNYIKKEFSDHKEFVLMKEKGVYPYEWMDSFSKFDCKKLPNKSDFYSTLNGKGITDEQYSHAQKARDVFNLKTMGDYHDLKSDVLLLTDVFKNFRKMCSDYDKLDPAHYITSPGLSQDAMLKMTGVNLELMSDIDMYQLIEKSMLGGISYIAKRHAEANNPYMSNYDEGKPTMYITYLDANNRYGWAISQNLPNGDFRWLEWSEVRSLKLEDYTPISQKGLILEVDLEYPDELHDLHNDYPLDPEKVKVTGDMLSEYCSEISEEYNIKTRSVSKLIPTLRNKKKYLLYSRNLQLHLDLGMKLKQIY